MSDDTTPRVGILMGSRNDLPVLQAGADVLTRLGIPYEIRVLSAHRTPDQAGAWADEAADRGVRVVICAAGLAAHLAGAIAARTLLPVIGVPLEGGVMGGLDALLSTVQMPPGVPVGTVAVGKVGAQNAAWLAARILALGDPAVAERLRAARDEMTAKVLADDAAVQGGKG